MPNTKANTHPIQVTALFFTQGYAQYNNYCGLDKVYIYTSGLKRALLTYYVQYFTILYLSWSSRGNKAS